MGLHEALRLLAGSFVVISLALGFFVHPGFYLFTLFVGLNLVQSAFTRTCPAMWAFRKLGLREDGAAAAKAAGSCCG